MVSTHKESITHDIIRVGEILFELTEGGVARNVTREANTRLNVIFFQKLDHIKSVRAHEWKGKPIGHT
jgi:hypothetical protein